MSIHMELRCERRGELPIKDATCWSDVDRGLWAMALNTHESTEQTTTDLLSMVTQAGWQSINGDWILPWLPRKSGINRADAGSRRKA